MFYLFFLFFSKLSLVGSVLLVGRLMSSATFSVEEREHILFALVSIIVLLFVWPVLEGGMKLWCLSTVVVISCLFCCSSPLLLYVFLELSLVPVVVLIMGWGVQRERIRAGVHLVVYTFLFSSPFLVSVVVITNRSYQRGGSFFRIFIGMALMVKTPLYLLHV